MRDAKRFLEDGEKMQLTYTVRNTMRAIGTRTSHHIVQKYGMKGLNPGQLTLELRGSAGQSLGAFAVQGLKLKLFGDANDYVGKGLSGATIVVRPMVSSPLESQDNTIIGNTVLYGATAGKLFAAGQAGERFAVRNSGALDRRRRLRLERHRIHDRRRRGDLRHHRRKLRRRHDRRHGLRPRSEKRTAAQNESPTASSGSVSRPPIGNDLLVGLIEEHVAETGSRHAKRILQQWDLERGYFWQVCPKEMLVAPQTPAQRRTGEWRRA